MGEGLGRGGEGGDTTGPVGGGDHEVGSIGGSGGLGAGIHFSGDTLELRYFGILSATDAGLGESRPGRIRMRDLPNPALEPGWSQVVMRRGSGWLVARAPMPRESLQFLLRMLQ